MQPYMQQPRALGDAWASASGFILRITAVRQTVELMTGS